MRDFSRFVQLLHKTVNSLILLSKLRMTYRRPQFNILINLLA